MLPFDENIALKNLEILIKNTHGVKSSVYLEYSNWKLYLMRLKSESISSLGLSPEEQYQLRRVYDGLNRIALALGKKSFTELGIESAPTPPPSVLPQPISIKAPIHHAYDVAISCAGEDTIYIDKVVKHLINAKIRVFYYKFEDVQVDLWGKDLYVHLDEIYRKNARYCVMFLSHYYANKVWTNHERRSAQARAFEENREYILPVRFDDTEIPGIVPTISYLDANIIQPEQLAELIKKKISS